MEAGKEIKFLLVFVIMFMVGCQAQEKKRTESAEKFLKIAQDKNIEVFYDLVLIPRKLNSESNKYQLGRLVYESNVNGNREQIDLPVIRKEMKETEVQLLPFYNNIHKFSTAKGITVDSAKKYISQVVTQYEELNVIEITSHPDLGRFIVFKINNSDELIYKEEEAPVYHEYWRKYFATALKLKPQWYFFYSLSLSIK